MERKSIFLIFMIVIGLMSTLGCSDSDDNSETTVESEDIQTGEAKAVQEEEPASDDTEENEAVTETPASDDTEESKTVTLEEAKVEEAPEEDEENLDEEYRDRLAEQEEEEEDEEEPAASTVSSDDALWISVIAGDVADVQADMNDVSRAAANNDIASLTVYTDNLYTSTQTAIDHCDEYDVSADLQPVEDEYRLSMVAYNWAAVYCYAGIEAYNVGNAAEFTASFNDATEFMNSGTEHTLKATDLINEYNENHGV